MRLSPTKPLSEGRRISKGGCWRESSIPHLHPSRREQRRLGKVQGRVWIPAMATRGEGRLGRVCEPVGTAAREGLGRGEGETFREGSGWALRLNQGGSGEGSCLRRREGS